jgi:CRP-like cAMP-binding protein
MYVMLEGRARVLGKSRVLRPGNFFGEMALIEGGPRSATISAASQVRVMMLQRQAFLKVLKQNPQIGLAIMGRWPSACVDSSALFRPNLRAIDQRFSRWS